jgi:hypothetical protein
MRQNMWLPLFPLFFAAVFGALALSMAGEARRFASEGVTAEAEVLDRERRTRTDSDGSRSTSYYVTYRFELPGGGTQTNRDSVGSGFYSSVRVGDRVPVVYLPSDPGISEIEPGSTQWLSRIFGLVAIVALGGTVGLGAWFGRRCASALRAARHGEVREARVLSHQESNVTINGHKMWRLYWRDARDRDGRSWLNRYDRLAGFPPNSRIVVYVDPQSGEAHWEEDLAPAPADASVRSRGRAWWKGG